MKTKPRTPPKPLAFLERLDAGELATTGEATRAGISLEQKIPELLAVSTPSINEAGHFQITLPQGTLPPMEKALIFAKLLKRNLGMQNALFVSNIPPDVSSDRTVITIALARQDESTQTAALKTFQDYVDSANQKTITHS